jgi:pimeloyl-ACP methyl ester carboxylesterase
MQGMEFQRRSVQCATSSGLHRLSYLEWSGPDPERVVICVHGLTRAGRDFDFLARALRDRYRVVCPDLPGRGESDWLPSAAEYAGPTYINDMVTLIARLDVESVDWVGTSLGGMIGMAMAALPGTPVRKLLLNDVGPLLTAASLNRIGEYVGKVPAFPTLDAAEQFVRTIAASFGPHSDAEWRFLTENVVRREPGGEWRMRYDPAIAHTYNERKADQDMDIWPLYEAVKCPTLVLRGAESDLLTAQTAKAMTQRGPRARVVEIPGVGHAPTLISERQIAVVRDFLLS